MLNYKIFLRIIYDFKYLLKMSKNLKMSKTIVLVETSWELDRNITS